MRVMHILDSLNRGGVEILALDICRNARANGLDLTFVATGGGDLEDDFRRSGVEFIRLQRRLPVDPQVVTRLREIIKQRNFHVVHCYQAVEGLHVYLATLGTRTKRILSFQGYAPDAKNRWTLNFLARRMDANVAPSKDFLSTLKNREGFDISRNFHVVYNAVDAKRLRPAGDGLRAELGLAHPNILLGMVGNFYPDARKDQMTVCKALPELFRQVPNAHFAFVGGYLGAGAQLYEDCVRYCAQRQIAGRTHFLGKRPDIPEVLDALDIFVFSTLKDTFGIAAVEAMLMGLPVVVSDIGALLEVTGDGEYAATFRTGDAADLAGKLTELCRDEHRRNDLGGKGKDWATTHFSIEAHIASLIKLYNQI